MIIIDEWTDGFAKYRKVRTGHFEIEYIQIQYPGEVKWTALPLC